MNGAHAHPTRRVLTYGTGGYALRAHFARSRARRACQVLSASIMPYKALIMPYKRDVLTGLAPLVPSSTLSVLWYFQAGTARYGSSKPAHGEEYEPFLCRRTATALLTYLFAAAG